MRTLVFATLLLLQSAPVHAVEAAPPILLPSTNGSIELAKLRGKVVYVDFWASWCAPCRKSFPWMNQIQRRYVDEGLKIVAINVDKDRSLVDRFLEQVPADFTIAYDPAGTTPEAFHVKGMPSSYLIDRDGTIRYSHIGFREISKLEIESQIRTLLEEK